MGAKQRGTKMRKKSETHMKATLTFIAAGMAGAALALLFAPQSGKKTRRAIQGAGEDLVDRAEALQEDLSERVAALVEDAFAIAEEGLDKGKGITEKVHEDLLSTLQTSKDLIARQIERAQHLVH
jgi:gas vesicle protein